MARLKDIPLRLSYRTGRDDLVRDFYVPALGASNLYRRAAGYFTSSGLSVAAQGVADLVSRNGKMMLVASPHLDGEDIQALQSARDNQEAVLMVVAAKGLQQIRYALEYDRLNALAWLAASGSLEVKLALRVDSGGRYLDGIYHEKMGVLTDADGDHVAFSGSSNETAGGLIGNFESIKVFRSWSDSEGRVQEEIENFRALWSNTTPGLQIIDFSNASEDLLRPYKRSRPKRESSNQPDVQHNNGPSLWPHQAAALEAFLLKKAGIVEMATGTGKTRLAISICEQLAGTGDVETIIVATDGNDLLDQWYGTLLQLIGQLGKEWVAYRHYEGHKGRTEFLLSPENSLLLISREFLPLVLQSIKPGAKEKTILIHDEVHRFGSPSNRKNLAGAAAAIPYRLGLSATPEREYDEEGNTFITAEIGPVIYQFGLEDAIKQRILAPFDYYPIPYCPNDEDGAKIQRVYAQQAARKREGHPMSKAELWTELAKVYKTSRAKLAPFREFIAHRPGLLNRCIVFVETKEYGEEVLDIIHETHHEFHTYFGGEDSATLHRFARGEIECLLTCHRLSEGIDIQSLTSVILFSSARNRLETIQRIGRCLRTDPRDPSKIANVIDFIRQDRELTADEDRAVWLTALSKIRHI